MARSNRNGLVGRLRPFRGCRRVFTDHRERFDSVRVFPTWEDFQPAPVRVNMEMLRRLVSVADLAGRAGIAVMPSLYTGHMQR